MGDAAIGNSCWIRPFRHPRRSFRLPYERHAISQDPASVRPTRTSPAPPAPPPRRAARHADRRLGHLRTDRWQPRAVLHWRPGHAEHLAGTGAGLRRAGRRGSRREGDRGKVRNDDKVELGLSCSSSTRCRIGLRWCARRADHESARSTTTARWRRSSRPGIAGGVEGQPRLAESTPPDRSGSMRRIPARSRCTVSDAARPLASRPQPSAPRPGRSAQGEGVRRR